MLPRHLSIDSQALVTIYQGMKVTFRELALGTATVSNCAIWQFSLKVGISDCSAEHLTDNAVLRVGVTKKFLVLVMPLLPALMTYECSIWTVGEVEPLKGNLRSNIQIR